MFAVTNVYDTEVQPIIHRINAKLTLYKKKGLVSLAFTLVTSLLTQHYRTPNLTLRPFEMVKAACAYMSTQGPPSVPTVPWRKPPRSLNRP